MLYQPVSFDSTLSCLPENAPIPDIKACVKANEHLRYGYRIWAHWYACLRSVLFGAAAIAAGKEWDVLSLVDGITFEMLYFILIT